MTSEPSGDDIATALVETLNDDELVAHAREVFQRMRELPCWHDQQEALTGAWFRALREVGNRGIVPFLTFTPKGEPVKEA